MQLAQLIKSGGNPENMLRQMAQQNPMVAQAMKMVDGKTREQVSQMAANMAKERGVDIDALSNQIRQTLGL